MKWFIKGIKQYADFQGRARRTEYWMFSLFCFIIMLVATALDNILGTKFEGNYYGLLYALCTLALCIPSLAVSVRRLHDIGKSGWMFLISLIPIVGAIWLIVLMATEGNHGANAYGPDPKDEPAE
jgi:uncharacterized membrane protein YhaH (DUF805 family)